MFYLLSAVFVMASHGSLQMVIWFRMAQDSTQNDVIETGGKKEPGDFRG